MSAPRQRGRISVAIAGGGLQGLEMTYLAMKAGFETLLVDNRSDAPASGICGTFLVLDLTDHEALNRALGLVDLVIPATENSCALKSLAEWCRENGKPLAFDPYAYAISSSKCESDALFRKLGIPAPTHWPGCSFPVLAKPDGESGSRGVEVFSDNEALETRFGPIPPSGYILQEYLTGPSYSIEVVGRPGEFTPFQTTCLEMDRDFDCKRVLAPAPIPSEMISHFEEMALTLAEALALTGIMDIEVILHGGELKVLEIDARFPSQTPIAIYHSTGINMVERLAEVFFDQAGGLPDPGPNRLPRGSILEHIRVRDGQLSVLGEHIMVADGPLHFEAKFFGADEALTSYVAGKDDWVATLMVTGSDLEDATKRRDLAIEEIRNRFGLKSCTDEYPHERLGQGR